MSAGKLSRFTGLVFVLAAFAGAAGTSVAGIERGTGGQRAAHDSGVFALYDDSEGSVQLLDYEWN